MHKGGKKGRKTMRAVKRQRYNASFERRYGMSRKAWVEFKETHTPAEVHAKRVAAIV